MNVNSRLSDFFKPEAARPATMMDRTTAVAREITDAAARDRAERTARLRAMRLERAAFADAPAKRPVAKRKSAKA